VRWAFFLFTPWHEFHPAFRTVAGMFCHDFRMHRTGVFLFLLMLLLIIVLVARAIEVNRPYLCGSANRERYRAGKNKNPLLHVGSYVFCSGSRVGCGTPAATAEDLRAPKASGAC
jgi:hypothetical protein